MKKPLIIHIFLFAIFPVAFFTVSNIAELWAIGQGFVLSKLAAIALVVLFFALLLWVLLRYVFNDWHKSGVLVSLFLLMFFSYGHFSSLIQKIEYKTIFGIAIGQLQANYLYSIIWIIVFLWFIRLFRKKTSNFYALTRFFNTMGIVLSCFLIFNIGVYVTKHNKLQNASLQKKIKSLSISDENKKALPDIYYIILDGYCAESTLKEYYHYDNGGFINYLKEKGFYIASESASNYAFTILSLASSLNMEYLDNLTNIMGINSTDLSVPLFMIKDNEVESFLKSKGYDVVHIGWQDSPEYDFFADLTKTTILSFFSPRRTLGEFSATARRERISRAFSKFKHARIASNKPIFVYAHLPVPHSPYVFGANGEFVRFDDNKGYNSDQYYINQLIFASNKIKEVIDEILSETKPSPIIVLQSDHGRGDNMSARMRILNAYYLPQDGKRLLYKSISPVNTFRIIFNKYFNANYKLLNDQSYFSWWAENDKPYAFSNVTDEASYIKADRGKLYSEIIFALYTDKAVELKYNADMYKVRNANGHSRDAAYFNGTDSSIKTTLSLEDLKGATIMFWVKPGIKQNNKTIAIINNGHSAEKDFVLQSVDTSKHEYTFHCFGIDSTFNLPAGSWTHFLVTIDLSKNTFDVYLNSKKYSSLQIPRGSTFGPASLAFAKLSKVGERYFCGAIDEVFIWPRPLSEKEIKIITADIK